MIRKLLIAIPCYETMRVEFFRSVMGLVKRLNAEGVNFDVKDLPGTVIHTARDNLAKHAVNNGYSHVLWLDSDMVFEDTILEDLTISGKTDDILCGRFISRHNPYLTTLFSKLDPDVERIDEDHIPDETFRIAACGFACVLTPAETLRAVLNTSGGTCFLPTKNASEDLAFCQRATGAGFSIWCEPTARVGHVGAVTIWPEDGKRIRGEIQGLEGKTLN